MHFLSLLKYHAVNTFALHDFAFRSRYPYMFLSKSNINLGINSFPNTRAKSTASNNLEYRENELFVTFFVQIKFPRHQISVDSKTYTC